MTLNEVRRHIHGVEGCSAENALSQLRAELPLILKRWADARDPDDVPPSSSDFWERADIFMDDGGVVVMRIEKEPPPGLARTAIPFWPTAFALRPLLVDRRSVLRRWPIEGSEPVAEGGMVRISRKFRSPRCGVHAKRNTAGDLDG